MEYRVNNRKLLTHLDETSTKPMNPSRDEPLDQQVVSIYLLIMSQKEEVKILCSNFEAAFSALEKKKESLTQKINPIHKQHIDAAINQARKKQQAIQGIWEKFEHSSKPTIDEITTANEKIIKSKEKARDIGKCLQTIKENANNLSQRNLRSPKTNELCKFLENALTRQNTLEEKIYSLSQPLRSQLEIRGNIEQYVVEQNQETKLQLREMKLFMEDLKRKFEELKEESEEAKTESRKMKKELKKSSENNRELSAEIITLKEKINNLEKKVDQLEQENRDLHDELLQKDEELKANKQSIQELTDQLAKKEQEVNNKDKELSLKEKTIESLQTEVADLKNNLNKIKQEQKDQTGNIQKMIDKIQILTSQIQKLAHGQIDPMNRGRSVEQNESDSPLIPHREREEIVFS